MAVSGDRNERFFRIWWTLNSLSATPVDSPPAYLALKNIIVELQLDIKTEAIELMRNGDYSTAVMYLYHGIYSSGLLRRGRLSCFTTVDAELLVLRSECANNLGYSQAAVQDAEDAIIINGDYSSAWVQLVKAKFEFARAEGEVALAEFEDFLRCKVSEKHKKIPVIKDITARLENLLGPAVPHHRCRKIRDTKQSAKVLAPSNQHTVPSFPTHAATPFFQSPSTLGHVPFYQSIHSPVPQSSTWSPSLPLFTPISQFVYSPECSLPSQPQTPSPLMLHSPTKPLLSSIPMSPPLQSSSPAFSQHGRSSASARQFSPSTPQQSESPSKPQKTPKLNQPIKHPPPSLPSSNSAVKPNKRPESPTIITTTNPTSSSLDPGSTTELSKQRDDLIGDRKMDGDGIFPNIKPMDEVLSAESKTAATTRKKVSESALAFELTTNTKPPPPNNQQKGITCSKTLTAILPRSAKLDDAKSPLQENTPSTAANQLGGPETTRKIAPISDTVAVVSVEPTVCVSEDEDDDNDTDEDVDTAAYVVSSLEQTIPVFQHSIKYVCGICFIRQGGAKLVEQNAGSVPSACNGAAVSHAWAQCKIPVMYSDSNRKWCEVKPRHRSLRPSVFPRLCQRGKSCTRSDCLFAHISEEINLWVYMADYKMTTLEEVIAAAERPSDVVASPLADQESPEQNRQYDCSYCGDAYSTSWELQQHTQTPGHWSKVNSDSDKKDQWRYRDPPWDVVNGDYQECQENTMERCIYTGAQVNSCTKAHSLEELEEWKERHRYRIMKVEKAIQQKLYAFMDGVLQKYNSGSAVIAEELLGVSVACSENLSQVLPADRDDGHWTYSWSFTIKPSDSKRLKRVCLFYDDNRLRFRLSEPAREREAQVCSGNLIVEDDGKTWQIDVIFQSQMLGSFSQWVLFDFGFEPYLVRKLKVQVGSAMGCELLNEMQIENNNKVEVWNSTNQTISVYEDDYKLTNGQMKLLARYQVPESVGIGDLDELSRDNYKDYMHRMLSLEEQACNEKISKFATECNMKCLDKILTETLTGSVAEFSCGGSKFGRVDLKKALMDDSETSQIIENNVHKMMLRFRNSKKIYEATIFLNQDDMNNDNQDDMYVKLSPACVTELKLKKDTEYHVEIQLQLDRLPFCYMHSAVDGLQNLDMVFPPNKKSQKLPPLILEYQGRCDPRQNQAVQFISNHGGPKACQISGVGPLLICGPFGTGKTYTLALAVERTLQLRPDSRVLICTQSNSAADLYITEHLHRLVECGKIRKMIRLCAKYRNIRTISDTVRMYITINRDGNIQIPNTKKIKSSSVVVTTLATSHRLVSCELRGHFTHILIDEAGQALETETLQPLTLATVDTCVVLAGDHLQMSQKVFSQKARHAKFNTSLLERLFYHKVARVLLSSNYRTCPEVLEFVSQAFYCGAWANHQLKAIGHHEPLPEWKHPLAFYCVKGEDQKIGMSYVNQYEVRQIGLIAKDLCNTWPEEKWGRFDRNSIGIVTPYTMQVRQIRDELRKHSIATIDVGTVQIMQGKQFRVVIVTTVRTHNTLKQVVGTRAVASKIRPLNRSEDTFDYGFLSDPKLLNTAFTRAQSRLIVIGDPMALCSIGECSNIWRRYLTECEVKGTLFPKGTSVENIRQEIESVKNRVNPCTAVCTPAASSISPPAIKHSLVSEVPHLDNVDSWHPKKDDNVPDGILRELYRQIEEDERMSEDASKNSETAESLAMSRKRPTKFRMIEENDRITLAFNYKTKSTENATEFLDEGGLKNDMHNEKERLKAFQNAKQMPYKYKMCTFHCDTSGHTYAVPLEEGSSGKILITSKRRRGRALNLDEVIVEILDDDTESEVVEVAEDIKTCYGKVVCISKRAARSALNNNIVCKLDEHINNLMVPIDHTLPKLYVLSHNDGGGQKRTTRESVRSPDYTTVSIKRNINDNQFEFVKNVKVSRRDRKQKLFLVRYVEWMADNPYPVGVVTEDLPEGDNKETGLRILNLLCGVKEEWHPRVLATVERDFASGWSIPDSEIKSRYDARGIKVFTIDPPECDDIDDALSVELVNDNYEVGIHIADVPYFVKKDTPLDREAKIRATSFYLPSGTPIGMLPGRLGNGLCSLLPDKDRLTVSVFITLDKSGAVMGINKFMRSITRSCRKLNYATVETIINSRADESKCNSSVEEKIQTLSKLARARRSSRLGVGQHVFHHKPEEETAQYPFAHSLVEEMMLLANEAVASFVMGKYPDCSPLRRQLAPSEENIAEWMAKHGKDVPNSLDLQSKTLLTKEQGDASDMKLLKEKWDELCAVVTSKEGHVKMTRVTDLITSDENHPRLAAAKVNYCLMQEASSYISTGDYPDQEMRKHHSLNMTAYTHFTSPIRRYFDIVVHRMLTAAIDDERAQDSCHRSEIPHTDSEIAAIAHNCNYQNFNSRNFEKKANALQYALILRECPLSFKVFVSGISDSAMDLFFPHRHFLSSDISLNLLKPTNRPDITEDSIQMELHWKERVFELSGSSTSTSQGSQRQQLPEKGQQVLHKLDTNQMIVSIPAEQWQGILTSVQAQDLRMIQKAIANADHVRKGHEKAQRRPRQSVIKEVTCETGPGQKSKPLPFVNFKRHFERGDVIQVQLNALMQMGILMPSIQLVYLTPKLNFCVEHRANPIESFSRVAAHRPPLRITDITRYKDMWLPILEMMSAYDAIRNDEACVLHGVDIKWKCCQEDNRPSRYSGKFTIKKMFCHYRNIGFNRGDYVCIRYSDLPLPPNTKHRLKRLGIVSTETGHSSTIDGERYTFVAHAVISNVKDVQAYTDNWTMAVQVAVNQHSAPFPDALVIPSPKVTMKCAVELILKESTDRRLITAVNHLNSADQLIEDICLHHKPSVDKTDPIMTRLLQASSQIGRLVIPGSPYADLNNPQQKAIRLALQQQFTIIQGPPGTGKTITGAYLAYFFTEVNKQLPSNSGRGPPQVLYCGPSNKSVDVVGGYLLHLGIPVIRVYSKLVEQQVYPIPGHSYKVSKLGDSQEAKMDPSLKHTSLHHLIRNSPNSWRDSILRFDRRCQKRDHAISFQELLEYRKIVRKAEAEVLRRFKVVLCTCSEAGSRRIQDLNVIQCIVDEAGMCSEPETLIPLVGTLNEKESRKDPRQVVLIGDHKQLRPIIQERTAVQLGMEISLLEKYEEKATMLTIQYRMHESICAFPSEVFYRGSLVTDASVKQRKPQFETIWPGARRDPLVFCHHVGVEESQSVRTEEGNEQSRANVQEVKHVVRIASVMVEQLGVKQDDVVILTQYRLQKAQITDKMAKVGLEGVAVSTVITSQGREWDYVILSTVRSLPRVEIDDKPSPSWKRRNLGFITDEHQMNVAITRPRLGLIILGNRYLLGVHDTWNRLLNHYQQMNAVVHADQFLKAYNLRK